MSIQLFLFSLQRDVAARTILRVNVEKLAIKRKSKDVFTAQTKQVNQVTQAYQFAQKLAGLAGIVGVGAVITIRALSQRHQNPLLSTQLPITMVILKAL